MTHPSFAAFKVAFLDPGSRVRLSLSEEPHSSLESLRIHGGYLDGVDARFSEHLNAVIGGRGTGKSTLIECVRYALELTPNGKQGQRVHQDVLKANVGNHAGSITRFVPPPVTGNASRSPGATANQPSCATSPAPSPIKRRGISCRRSRCTGRTRSPELAVDEGSRLRLLERFCPAAAPATFDIKI